MRTTVWLAILMVGLATPSLSTASAHGPQLVQARVGQCPPGTHATVAKSGPESRARLGAGSSAHCKVTFFPSDEDVRRLVQPYFDKHQTKGIVLGLVEPDGRRRVLIFGEAGQSARALSAKSVFEIGSITKTFTGTVLADMVRRGKVRLDDPVAKYLPADVRVPSRNGRQITLLDLATHMSGLPRLPTGYVSPDPGNPYAHFSADDLYAFLNRYELEREPGEKAEYSNLGMGLLGHALARAAKARSFEALVTSRVLKPLRMRMTAYGRPPELAPWMTKGHTQGGEVAPYFDPGVLAGGGGLNSNVVDMMTYLDANIGKPRSPIERAMRDAHRGYRPGPAAGSQMGLAWMPRTRGSQTLLGHNGGTSGYSTYLAFDPAARAGVVVLANCGGFEYADKIGRELLERGRRPVAAAPPTAKNHLS